MSGVSDIILVNEAQAREVCAAFCAAADPGLPRLKTIAAVGALSAKIGSSREDSRRLTGVLSYLLRSGFLIDPNFMIDRVDFHQKRDFLKETSQADLVFVSYILARHKREYKTYRYHPDFADIANATKSDILGLALSDRNHGPGWRDRLLAGGTKLIATYGGLEEVGTHTLCDPADAPWLLPLIETPRAAIINFVIRQPRGRYRFDFESRADLATLYNNAANDLPMPWLAFAGDKRYLAAALPGVSGNTALGRRAIALCPQ